MAVLLTPPFLQFFDNNGDPLANGKVYTYAAGTTTPKATFTTQAGDVEAANPVILDSAGRATIWIVGSYKFVVTDSNDVTVKTTDNVTAFQALAASNPAYFQTFSGNASQTAFTTSQDLGSEEKAIFVWVDAGGDDGYQIQNPSAYTISGTTLTFSSAPAAGTNNIYVSAPSLLIGAASAAADNAAASAADAAQDAIDTAADAVATAADVVLTNADVVTTNADAASAAADAQLAEDWATKTDGQVAATDYSAKAWAIGGTGTTTNNAKYWAEQAEALTLGDVLTLQEQGSTPGTPASGYSKLYLKTDSRAYHLDDAGTEVLVAATAAAGAAGQVLTSAGAGFLPAWTSAGAWVLLETQTGANDASLAFSTAISSSYTTYAIVYTGFVPATDGANIAIQASTDSGANWLADTNYDFHIQKCVAGTATYSSASASTGNSYLSIGPAVGSDTGEAGSGCVFINNPSSTTLRKVVHGTATSVNTNALAEGGVIIGSVKTTSAINAIRVLCNSGNISLGTFKLYGIR